MLQTTDYRIGTVKGVIYMTKVLLIDWLS